MEMKRVLIAKLKSAPHNPADRTEGPRSGITQLAKSIEKVGLVVPITVTKSNHIIEGHRRVTAAKLLGWDSIQAIVMATDNISAEHIYAEVNANMIRLSGNQNLHVYLSTPQAVTESAKKKYETLEAQFGLPMLNRIVAKGLSVNILNVANKIALYLDLDSDAECKKIATWLMSHRNSLTVRAYMTMNQPTKPLMLAIKNNRPLKATYSAG